MSSATRSHRPPLVKLDSNDEVVGVAKPGRTSARQSSRKRSAPDTPQKPSSKRAKIAPSPSSSNKKKQKETKNKSKKKDASSAPASPTSTRQSGRERSVEIPLMSTPRRTRHSHGAVEEEGEEEEEDEDEDESVGETKEQSISSRTRRSTIGSTAHDSAPAQTDVWDIPQSSPEKHTRKLSRRKEAEDEDTAPVAGNALFNRRSSKKTVSKTRTATSTKKELHQSSASSKQPAAATGNRKEERSQRSGVNRPSKTTVPEEVDEVDMPDGETDKEIKKHKKRGPKPKPKSPGLELPIKRGRGRPRKIEIPESPDQEAQADADDEDTDDAIAVRVDVVPALGKADVKLNDEPYDEDDEESQDDEVVEEAKDDNAGEDIENDECGDIVEQTQFHSGRREGEDNSGSEYSSGVEVAPESDDRAAKTIGHARKGTGKRGDGKGTVSKNKDLNAIVVASTNEVTRKDAAGIAQKSLYEKLNKYDERAKELKSRFEEFYEETKDLRKKLLDSRNSVQNAFTGLVDALDTKGTYEFSKSRSMQYDIKRIDSRDVPHLPNDPFGPYPIGFDPTDERVRKLFKDSEERNADMDLLENVQEKFEMKLAESEGNLEIFDKMYADAERPIRLLAHRRDEVEDLIDHESSFARDYQNARLKQAEMIKQSNEKRRKINAMKTQNSTYIVRDNRERHTTRLLHDRERASSSEFETHEIDTAQIERVSIPAFGSRNHDAPPMQGSMRQTNTSEWTRAEEQTLLVGMDEFGLAADNFIMIKQTYGSEPGSILYNRDGSEIRSKALEIKKFIKGRNGKLPPSWANV